MKRAAKIAIGIGTALSLGVAAAVVNAQPYGYGPRGGMGYGPGPHMGWGPGAHMGWGPGAGAGPMGPGMGYGMGFGGMGMHGFGYGPAAADGRLAALKSELKITAAQESQWQAFAGQAKQGAEAMQSLITTMQNSQAATAPERLALRNEIMKKRLEQSEKSAAAFKDLYAALTPEQKAIMDQGPRGPGYGGYGPGRGGPGGRFR